MSSLKAYLEGITRVTFTAHACIYSVKPHISARDCAKAHNSPSQHPMDLTQSFTRWSCLPLQSEPTLERQYQSKRLRQA